ncbi:PA0069 family radical SAM protein [Marinilongibacter aquaticus]|uniref:PA0069 family radical SAM protein n=1 Tax=Marinilongibacter aquaticus TaxID=2975157 RepID=UPI0021BD2F5B|nr:PA0069 family radical SAM protein [Marinilongibacter aquaticus]UBM57836.1 PA0069 family radical SAM protein [Marinilongibacter aquaticus]
MDNRIKGRGAQINSSNRFLAQQVDYDPDFAFGDEENFRSAKTKFLEEHPKKIVNEVKSPDLPMGKSVNPYQGCEHGCVYCYARNTHEYFGYSAGLDFEQKIIVKKNAAQLLEKEMNKKTWQPTTILFSGNTDCYQPAEKKFALTRKMLAVCLKYRNPAAIITKNALVLRDLDILTQLAKLRLIKVVVSITTLNEELRRHLEPRAVSAFKRLDLVKKLHENGVPAFVNIAPVIPGLNDHEIPEIVKLSAEYGALSANYSVVRLNGSVGQIFEDWIRQSYPNKAEKVLHQIKEMHGGNLNDSQFGRRMRGEGAFSDHIKQLHRIAVQNHFKDIEVPEYDFTLFRRNGQLNLF